MTSVPSDAPDDYAALRDVKNKAVSDLLFIAHKRVSDPGYISQVGEVHFSCILIVILTLPLRLSEPLRRVRGCGRPYRTPPPSYGPAKHARFE